MKKVKGKILGVIGVNPYSIGRDSDVVKAFGKHGWNWGAGFSRADMMHFDY